MVGDAPSPSYSPQPSDDESAGDEAVAAAAQAPPAASQAPLVGVGSMRHRALAASCPTNDADLRTCPFTKTGLCALQRRDPSAYSALRALSGDRLPTVAQLPEWCTHGGGCETPCKGVRNFGLAEMLRHAQAKGSGASAESDDDDDDEVALGARLHAVLYHVLVLTSHLHAVVPLVPTRVP